MKYVLQRTDQGGGYVAPPGGKHSYVVSKYDAQRFDTPEQAEDNRCVDNERIIEMADLI